MTPMTIYAGNFIGYSPLSPNDIRQIHTRIGLIIRRRAVRYAPKSPTVAERKRFAKVKTRLKGRAYKRELDKARARVESGFAKKGVRVKKSAREGLARLILRSKGIGFGYSPKAIRARAKRAKAKGGGRAAPGGLERSISHEATKDGLSIFCAVNSEAGAYAKRIHDEKGTKWFLRGIGTRAKGPQADEKFITRAIVDSDEDVQTIIKAIAYKKLSR